MSLINFPSPGLQFSLKARPRVRLSHEAIATAVAALEWGALLVSSVLSQAIFQWISHQPLKDFDVSLGVGIMAASMYVLLAGVFRLYQLPFLIAPHKGISRLALAWGNVIASLVVILFLLKVSAAFSRGSILTFSMLGFCTLLGARALVMILSQLMTANKAIAGRPAVVIGEPSELRNWTTEALMTHFGIIETARVYLHPDDALSDDLLNSKLESAIEASRREKAEEFLVAVRWSQTKLVQDLRVGLLNSPLRVLLLPDELMRSMLAQRATSANDLIPSIELQRSPMTFWERALKRSFDVAYALVGLFFVAPLLAGVALAIKLDSGGPVLFRQKRNGFNGQEFTIYKFRTMHVLEDGPRIEQARRNDPRVTRVGRVLRRSSIDELPQLFNVLQGHMSLIGPRPHALAHDNEYKQIIANYAFRHHVKPGLTGWAQVHGYRGETKTLESMNERVKYDIWYINNWSLKLDFLILFRTVFTLLSKQAY